MNQDQTRQNLLLSVRHWAVICSVRASSWARFSIWLQILQFMAALGVYTLVDKPGTGWLCLFILALLVLHIAVDPCTRVAENSRIEGAMYERAIALASAGEEAINLNEEGHQMECYRVQKMNRLNGCETGG